MEYVKLLAFIGLIFFFFIHVPDDQYLFVIMVGGLAWGFLFYILPGNRPKWARWYG